MPLPNTLIPWDEIIAQAEKQNQATSDNIRVQRPLVPSSTDIKSFQRAKEQSERLAEIAQRQKEAREQAGTLKQGQPIKKYDNRTAYERNRVRLQPKTLAEYFESVLENNKIALDNDQTPLQGLNKTVVPAALAAASFSLAPAVVNSLSTLGLSALSGATGAEAYSFFKDGKPTTPQEVFIGALSAPILQKGFQYAGQGLNKIPALQRANRTLVDYLNKTEKDKIDNTLNQKIKDIIINTYDRIANKYFNPDKTFTEAKYNSNEFFKNDVIPRYQNQIKKYIKHLPTKEQEEILEQFTNKLEDTLLEVKPFKYKYRPESIGGEVDWDNYSQPYIRYDDTFNNLTFLENSHIHEKRHAFDNILQTRSNIIKNQPLYYSKYQPNNRVLSSNLNEIEREMNINHNLLLEKMYQVPKNPLSEKSNKLSEKSTVHSTLKEKLLKELGVENENQIIKNKAIREISDERLIDFLNKQKKLDIHGVYFNDYHKFINDIPKIRGKDILKDYFNLFRNGMITVPSVSLPIVLPLNNYNTLNKNPNEK